MAGTDEVIAYEAAATLLVDNVSEDREHRLSAVKTLGAPPSGADTAKAVRGLLRVLSDAPPDDPSRREAIRSLGKIGPAAASAVPRLGLMVFSESSDANERAEAVSSLSAMGPAAKGAAHSIGRAWQLHRITLEQAQLLYKIDPQAAATFNIPRP
jgi:HEAT repeat protein